MNSFNANAGELESTDEYLIRTFQTSFLSYELAKELCVREWKQSETMTVPMDTIEKLEFNNKRQFFNTINYFLHQNQKLCIGEDELNLIYNTNLLREKFSNPRDGKIKKLKAKVLHSILPSESTMDAKLFFDSLPYSHQKTLNDIFLGKLFDVDRINNLDEIKDFYFK